MYEVFISFFPSVLFVFACVYVYICTNGVGDLFILLPSPPSLYFHLLIL